MQPRDPFLKSVYLSIVALPDRFYPFATKIEGHLVRGRQSYEQAVARAFKQYGTGHFGYRLLMYREVFHFFGAVFFITSAALFSQVFFGSHTALYVLLFAAIAALTYQEFYVHPRKYGQLFKKGVTDWFTWVMPMVLFLFFFTL